MSSRSAREARISKLVAQSKHLVARNLLPRVLTVGRRLTPARPIVFVTGFPSTEGNAVETVRALLRRFEGRVVWADAPSHDYLLEIGFTEQAMEKLDRVKKSNPRTMWRYVTARAVFFTHGVYGEPGPDRRKPVINLWHGGGMKRSTTLFAGRPLRSRPADWIVGGSRLWGEETARLSDPGPCPLILSGYPRTDQLFQNVSGDRLRSLGIDPDEPFVVWMPSYRTSKRIGVSAGWTDSGDVVGDEQLADGLRAGVAMLREQGIAVVVKPHPMDALSRNTPGALIIDDAVLEREGITLYSLLGSSAGLITDTSSVWVDYLLLDRPIGYYFPDRDAFKNVRGFFPDDIVEWMPGPMLETAADFDSFADDVLTHGDKTVSVRALARDRCGLVQTRTAADDLLDFLSRHSVALKSSLRTCGRSPQGTDARL